MTVVILSPYYTCVKGYHKFPENFTRPASPSHSEINVIYYTVIGFSYFTEDIAVWANGNYNHRAEKTSKISYNPSGTGIKNFIFVSQCDIIKVEQVV
jgi:hypothetical protein